MTELKQVYNHSQITAAHFNPADWLGRWTEAGGGFVAGTAHLLRPPCQCDALDSLSQEIANPDSRQALVEHLRTVQS